MNARSRNAGPRSAALGLVATIGCAAGCFSPTGSGSTTDATTTTTSTASASAPTIAVSSSTDAPTTAATVDPTAASTNEPLPEPPTLQLGFSQVKQFDFSWAASAGADYYQLLERLPGGADHLQVGDNILEPSISLTMPLHLRFGASYVLRACNGGGCLDSEPVEVVDSMAAAIGYFKASNTDGGDTFGSVALSADGNTLAVGAPYEASADGSQDNNAAAGAGAVYVFVRAGKTWTQQAYLKAETADLFDVFGVDVALSANGNSLAVGAYGDDNVAMDAGAVYVFVRADNDWSQQARLQAANPQMNSLFGAQVAMSGDGNTLAVGASFENAEAGVVHVFVRTDTVWSPPTALAASNAQMGDHFGISLALSTDGQTLAVGAYNEDSDGKGDPPINESAPDAGAVYVFVSNAGVWMQEAYLKAANAEASDLFGASVALSADGNTLAVGADGEDSDGDPASNLAPASGAVYIFNRDQNLWAQQAYLKAANVGLGIQQFGTGVALSATGDVLAVSSTGEDGAATGIGGDPLNTRASDAGAAYMFVRADATWTQHSYVKAPNAEAGDKLSPIALSADGNTLALGAYNEDSAAPGVSADQADNAALDAGAVYLY